MIINNDISITTQPADITECIGGTTQLSVVATGGVGALTYQWESASIIGGPYTTIVGATSSSYTPPSTAAGTTYYRVVVSNAGNGCGSVTSNPSTVIINNDISITTQPADITECIGGTTQLSVVATGGVGTLTYQWESASIIGGPYTAIVGATSSSYTPPSTAAGTTYYRVVISNAGNGCGSVTSNPATVIINNDISITTQPSDITECIGGTTQLSVVATGGVGTLTYQWESSSTIGGPYTTIVGATSSSYTPPSTAAGTTYYRVVVRNEGNG